MSEEISCPECGEIENLAGKQLDGEIFLTCGECEHGWPRDSTKTCERCSGTEFFTAPMAIVQKSRGSQLSIVSTKPTYLCWACDRDLIDDQRQSGIALMPDELPTEN